jgi:hypothetical protein
MNPQLTLAAAKAHNGDLARQARSTRLGSNEVPAPGSIVLRGSTPDDAPSLRRLFVLESREPSPTGEWLLAEIDGEVAAALPLDGGRPVADPFRRTEDLLALLRLRAKHLGNGRPPLLTRLQRRGVLAAG